jgi:Tol biopolymer transport system component
MIGRQLSHFLIVEQIGAGGMGVVFKAVDLRLQRSVALKVLPPDFGVDLERKQRFFREAQAASALNHPGIVTVYEVDSADGVDFIAMEYVEGRSLDQILVPPGLPLPKALDYAIRIADALARAHAAGIVHRDLKPRNLIVTAEDQVKILDFGIAKRLDPVPTRGDAILPTQDIAPETREGVVMGTPHYMSPEQAQGRRVDARSDIFSFGAVVYEMLTGRPPFQGGSVAELMSAILRDQPPRVTTLRGELPAELERIVGKALEKDLEYRYQQMPEVLADLKRLRRDSGASLTVSAPATAPRRTAARVAAVVVAVLAVSAAAALWVVRSRRPQPPTGFRLVSTFPGSHGAPSFAPDGKMFAYVDAGGGAPQVWVKYLDSGDPVQVTSGDVPASRPRWSPKGDQIVFERRNQGLWSVSPLGGSPRQVLEDASCPDFFPDGERIVYDRGPELWTARVDGSDPRRVEGVAVNYFSFYSKRCAAVSPDGRWLAFYQPDRGPFGDFWIVPAAGGQPRRLTSDGAEGGGVAWAPDGQSLVVSSARRGSRTLWRLALDGGEPKALTTGAGEDREPDFAPGGRRLLYSNTRSSQALVLLDTRTGRQRDVLERRAHMNGQNFSPDGSRIAFFMMTDRLEQVFTVAADGKDLRQVTQGERQGNIMPRWSRDGTTLFFYQELGAPSFRKVPATGGTTTVVAEGWTWGVQCAAELDPRGRTVAYSLMETGDVKASVLRDLQTGREARLAEPLDDMRWSPDGKSLLGRGPKELRVCPADGGACRSLGAGSYALWSADGSRIFFARSPRPLDDPTLRSIEAWVMARDGTGARPIAVLEPELTIATPFTVSPDDQLAWIQARRGRQELWLAELPE